MDLLTFSAPMMCSGSIVFLESFSHISLASLEMSTMNSGRHGNVDEGD